MSKLFVLAALLAALVLVGCTSNKGSREYIPGRGWVPT
jgi:outer membrane murein-binding lipoprotein Lpp